VVVVAVLVLKSALAGARKNSLPISPVQRP